MVKEIEFKPKSGWMFFLFFWVVLLGGPFLIAGLSVSGHFGFIPLVILCLLVDIVCAVGMVEMALARLSEHEIVQLDDERRAAMVSNLLVVLCSGEHTQPVVNTGTLYQ